MGMLIVALCWAVCLFIGEWFTQGNAHLYAKALRKNCTMTARRISSEYDKERDFWTATYEYEYRGIGYTYKKNFWNEEPPEDINVFWDPHMPAKPIEVSDISTDKDYKEIAIVTTFGAIAAGVAGVIVPQLPLIFVGLVVLGVMLRHSTPGKVAMCVGLLGVIMSGAYWIEANLIGHYWRYESYDTVRDRIAVVDTLEPVEVANLYQDWSYLMENVHEAHRQAKVPVIGQYADRGFVEMEEIQWPTEYGRYHDYDFRHAILYPED